MILDFAVTVLDPSVEPVAGDDAAEVAWVPLHELSELPPRRRPLRVPARRRRPPIIRRRAEAMTADEDFSTQLEAWLQGDSPKTLGALGDVFAEKSFAVTILLLMFVPALPLPTGGITHVFELITVVLGLQMVLGLRTILLPERWRRRELGSLTTGKAVPFVIRRVRWFERFSRPRWAALFAQRWFLRILGVGVRRARDRGRGLAPPFTGLDTLPALGAVVVALAVILEDVVVLAIGLVIGTGGVVLILTIGAAILHVVGNLF